MAHAGFRVGLIGAFLAAVAGCGGGSGQNQVTTSTPAALEFSVQPSGVVAGEAISPAIDVSVLDQSGNLVATSTATITVAVSGSATLHGTVSAAAVGGHAVFTDLSAQKAGTGYILTASSDGLPDVTSDAFDVAAAAPSASDSTFVATPATLAAGEEATLVATLHDAFGNPVPAVDVVFAATGSANTLVQPAAATDADGVASGSLSSTFAEAKTLTATVGALALSAQPVVTVTAGAPDPAGSTLAASQASVPSDGTTVTLTVTVADAYGNLVAGQTVTLSASGDATLTQPTDPTDASGTATGSVSSLAPGTQTISAYVGTTLFAQVDVMFTAPQIPDAGSCTVSAWPTTVPADGSTAAVVTVTVRDSLGQSIAGVPVGLDQTGTASITPVMSTSGADGTAVFEVTSTALGSTTLTATLKPGSADAVAIADQPTVEFVTPWVVYVQQPGVNPASLTASATLDSGVFTISHKYSASGNAFKFVSPYYYGTNSNGFISLPRKIDGDFSMTATIEFTGTPKVHAASGFAVGITTGFAGTDAYAYVFMPSDSTRAGQAVYVSSATSVTNSVKPPTTNYAVPTTSPIQVTFSRTGSDYTVGFTSAGGSTATFPASTFTDGTTAYGEGAVYPCISFNNIYATVTSFVIQDGTGATLFDSATGVLVPYTPASLTLSSPTATVIKDQTATLTATALAGGGDPATVTAVADDPSIVDVAVTNNATDSTITLTGLSVGSTTVTVTNTADPSSATNTKTIAVTVEEFGTSDGYSSVAGRLYPAAGETAAYADGELSVTFDDAPTLSTGGSIDIYALADGSLVDRIFFADETQTVGTVTMKVGSQLARVSGNTVYFTPHFGRLAYGTSYYVAIPTTAIGGTFAGVAFVGFSNLNTVATWQFTIRPAPTLDTTVTVDGSQTSTADFRTLGGALMYLAANPVAGATDVTIDVAAGTYIELVNYRAATPNPALTITIRGPAGNNRGDDTIIQYTNGGNINAQTGRASFYFSGASLVLENLTLKNTGVRSVVAQAEAMYFASGLGYTVAAHNCTFSSNQDTIQTAGRAWFYDDAIEGNTDFIWGTSDAALFESCDLRVINDMDDNTYSIFVARTGTTGAPTVGKGYVLINSTVSVDAGITAAYGRDAGTGSFYDQVTILNNTFTGAGTLKSDLWVTTTAPLSLGDSTYVGWKSSGNTGLGAESATTAAGTASTIADVSTEFDTRDHILNRVVTVSSGTPTGFEAAATSWDVSALATAWGAP